MRTFKIYSLSNFQICNTVLLTSHQATYYYIPMTYFILFIYFFFSNWKLLNFLTSFTHPPWLQQPPYLFSVLMSSLVLLFRFHI